MKGAAVPFSDLDTQTKPCNTPNVIAVLPRPRKLASAILRSPWLENGDCLSAPEFLRRFEAMPGMKKAELIEGVVYMGSPVRYAQHGRPDGLIQMWLSHYSAHTPGTEFVSNTTVQLDIDNVPQPDSLLRILPESGGSSHVDERDYLVGPPELIVEIAASSASLDLHDKMLAYRRNGIKEYLVWRTTEDAFDWFVLVEGKYRPHRPDTKQVFQSVTFPGLWLPLKALLAQDAAAVLAILNAGLKSRPHKAFIADLAARKAARPRKV
jgi:Uma2 family endonuclease